MEEELSDFSGGFFASRWGRRLPPSLCLRCLLQCRPKIFNWLTGSDPRRAPWGMNLNLMQEVQGIDRYVGAGQIHLPLIPSAPNPICPKPRLPLTPFSHNPTWKMTPLPSCNNGSSLLSKKPTLLALPPLGRTKISGRLCRRLSMTKARK